MCLSPGLATTLETLSKLPSSYNTSRCGCGRERACTPVVNAGDQTQDLACVGKRCGTELRSQTGLGIFTFNCMSVAITIEKRKFLIGPPLLCSDL